MSNNSADSIREKADAAFLQAAQVVIERAKRFGTRIVGWENGQIVERTWQEIELELAKKSNPTLGD
jgi:hypothetical protein